MKTAAADTTDPFVSVGCNRSDERPDDDGITFRTDTKTFKPLQDTLAHESETALIRYIMIYMNRPFA
jgi:hypothetical protein